MKFILNHDRPGCPNGCAFTGSGLDGEFPPRYHVIAKLHPVQQQGSKTSAPGLSNQCDISQILQYWEAYPTKSRSQKNNLLDPACCGRAPSRSAARSISGNSGPTQLLFDLHIKAQNFPAQPLIDIFLLEENLARLCSVMTLYQQDTFFIQ